jgi:hypothetical protein
MNNEAKGMFNEDTYIELINEKIKGDENYLDGMIVKHIGSGIALTMNDKDITAEQAVMLSIAHDEVTKQANEIFQKLKSKLIRV